MYTYTQYLKDWGAVDLHEVCGEKHRPSLLVFDQNVPDGSPGIWINSRCGLIQYHNFGTSNKSYAHTAEAEVGIDNYVCDFSHYKLPPLKWQIQ